MITSEVAPTARPPRTRRVVVELAIQGRFTLRHIRFSNPQVQQQIDEISMRAQGRPAEATPAAALAPAQMVGDFNLNAGRIHFDRLDYTLPGAHVGLTGIYSLDGQQFDFHGNVQTDAQISERVSKWWQQLLLKPVDHFFRKDGTGTQVPIRISGTQNKPQFGLDFDKANPNAKDAPKPFHPTLNHQF